MLYRITWRYKENMSKTHLFEKLHVYHLEKLSSVIIKAKNSTLQKKENF